MHGFSTAGHFAEYSVSDYRNAMVLPEGIDMISAAPLFCAGVTGESLFAQSSFCRTDFLPMADISYRYI